MESAGSDRAAAWRPLFITMTHVLNTVEGELKQAEDLTLIDIGCLFALSSAGPGGAPMGSLAAIFAVDPIVITYRVKRLEGRGLVRREVDADNRRVTNAQLTDDGATALRRARRRLLGSADEHFFAHLDVDAPALLGTVLQPLLAAQQAARPPVERRRGYGLFGSERG